MPGKGSTIARERLGAAVRSARNAANWTQIELGQRCGWSQGKVQKIEGGTQSTRVADVDVLVRTLDTDETAAERWRELARAGGSSTHGNPAPTPRWANKFFELEQRATEIHALHSERVPGLIQSEQYMLTQFTLDGVPDVTASLRARRQRQALLDSDAPPAMHYVLSQSSLHRRPGGDRIAVDQAAHLLELTDRCPQLNIQILPFDAKVSYVGEDFTILTFSADEHDDDPPPMDTVYLEKLDDADYLIKDKEFGTYRDAMEKLREGALSTTDSGIFLAEFVRKYRFDF